MEDFVEKTDAELTEAIIGAAIEVHRALGPGLLESTYESCLAYELHSRGIEFQRQIELCVVYKGQDIDCGYRIDLLVKNRVILEIKAVDKLHSVHDAQLLTYLKLSGKRIGLLLNFNTITLKDGIRRRVV
jgi:GxxExxY protein